jgi:hypothetical protein
MSLLLKSREAKLSELEIDVDKDWQAKGITNIKQIATSMSKGDLVAKDTAILVRIQTGPDGYVLTSRGALKLPTWAPAGGALKYYFPVLVSSSHTEALAVVSQSIAKNILAATDKKYAYGDAPSDYIKRLIPTVALTDAETIVAPDRIYNKNSPLASECAIHYVVGGAVLDDGGVQTDYTAQINSPAANDVPLLPVAPLVINDAFYFGLSQPWDQLWLNIGVPGDGNWLLVEEYWNGTAWAALTVLKDNTNQFMTAGKNNIKWTRPGDWALTTILGMNLYWIRARVAAVVSYTIQPLGTQGWCEVIV